MHDTADEALNFGLWLIDQGLIKTLDEKPDDQRGMSELLSDFRGRHINNSRGPAVP